MTVGVTGIKETQQALRKFNDQLADVITRKSLRAGANFLMTKIRADIPVKTGRLKRATTVKQSRINTRRRNGKIGLYFTIRKGKSRKDLKGAYYGGWVHSGYQFRKIRKGPVIKDIPGNFFVKKNFQEHGATSARLIMESINTSGQTILNKLKAG
jgi:hypothetical protein